MTDQEINVAIAEALGVEFHKPTEKEIMSGSYYQYEPDYCHDLNAMHEAEKTLTEYELQGRYPRELASLVVSCGWLPESATSILRLCHATARQRAEAFLRTLGLWKESK